MSDSRLLLSCELRLLRAGDLLNEDAAEELPDKAGDGGGNDSKADMDGAIFIIFMLTTLLSASNLIKNNCSLQRAAL